MTNNIDNQILYDDTFHKCRRNIILSSIILYVTHFHVITISGVQVLGVSVGITKSELVIFLFSVIFYSIYRFSQLIARSPDLVFEKAKQDLRENLYKNIGKSKIISRHGQHISSSPNGPDDAHKQTIVRIREAALKKSENEAYKLLTGSSGSEVFEVTVTFYLEEHFIKSGPISGSDITESIYISFDEIKWMFYLRKVFLTISDIYFTDYLLPRLVGFSVIALVIVSWIIK